jgi:hypothetical protein
VNQYKLQVFEEEYAYVMLIAIVDYGKFAGHDLVLAKSAKIAPSKRTRDTWNLDSCTIRTVVQ